MYPNFIAEAKAEKDDAALWTLNVANKVEQIHAVLYQNALENLDASLPGWDFEATQRAASDAWERELGKIRIQSEDTEQKIIFYTSLYHTMVEPALFSDNNGEFKGVKGDTRTANGYNRYTVFSLWDTYRALHPLFTLTQQARVNDMVKSMLDQYEQVGFLPVWELEGNETFTMVGNHSISVWKKIQYGTRLCQSYCTSK